MPAAQRKYSEGLGTQITVPHGAATLVATSPKVSTSFPGCSFEVVFFGTFDAAADITGLQLTVNRDSISGQQVGPGFVYDFAAGASGSFAVGVVDTFPIDAANLAWALAMLTTAGTDDGSTIICTLASVTVDVGGAATITPD